MKDLPICEALLERDLVRSSTLCFLQTLGRWLNSLLSGRQRYREGVRFCRKVIISQQKNIIRVILTF